MHESKPAEPVSQRPPLPRPLFSTIAPGDLGLKAGFWSLDEREAVRFRPIVGWVTVINALDANLGPLMCVVLNDLDHPAITQMALPDFIGVFPKEATVEQAREKFEQWRPKPAEGMLPAQGQSQSSN